LLFAGLAAVAAPASASIHAGDVLEVQVFNHPELSKKVSVDSAGQISYPLAGLVQVSGLDASLVAARLSRMLGRYVREASVDVQVVGEGASLNVAGGPGGKLAYTPGETLMTAIGGIKTIGEAQIERSRVDLTRVSLERDGSRIGTFDVTKFSASGDSGPALRPGDTIVFVDKPVAVQVEGAVAHPGFAHLAPSEPLADAIAQVGGSLPTAGTGSLTLIRGGQRTSIAEGDAVLTSPAQPGDVMVIPVAPRVTVAGSVTNPGVVTLKSNFSLVSALYTAGGPAKYANLHNVQVVQDGGARSSYDIVRLVKGDLSQNATLHDGDLVFVPQGSTFDPSLLLSNILSLRFLLQPK
jgi:polysaccharide export outer membrane protein